MKHSAVFRDYLDCANPAEVFTYFQDSLTDSITMWNYFVNWEKVFGNISDLEMDLNTLNYLVGKEKVEQEFRRLLVRHPSIYRLIPMLLACRKSDFRILTAFADGTLVHREFCFKPAGAQGLSEQQVSDACEFARETGFLTLFRNRAIKSVPDYVIGVEVGLDTNGRKNRGGSTMETIVESYLTSICSKLGLQLMTQATARRIEEEWDCQLAVDKTRRRFDFAIRNQETLYLVETNFYGGGGSKLKATAGEYKTLFDLVSQQGHRFIWITDGHGWRTTLRPLEETFNHIDYTLNLNMVSTGLLSQIVHDKL